MSAFNTEENLKERNKVRCAFASSGWSNSPAGSQTRLREQGWLQHSTIFFIFVISNSHLLLSAQINSPWKHYRTPWGRRLFRKIIYMLCIEEIARFFGCSDILRSATKDKHASWKKIIIPHWSICFLIIMLPQRYGKGKKHMQRRGVGVFMHVRWNCSSNFSSHPPL